MMMLAAAITPEGAAALITALVAAVGAVKGLRGIPRARARRRKQDIDDQQALVTTIDHAVAAATKPLREIIESQQAWIAQLEARVTRVHAELEQERIECDVKLGELRAELERRVR